MSRRLIFEVVPVLILVVFVLAGCSGEKEVKPDTPVNTAWLMKHYIDAGNYDNFNRLFSEGRKNAISKETFDSFKDLTTAGSDYKLYEIVTFQNGKMLLDG